MYTYPLTYSSSQSVASPSTPDSPTAPTPTNTSTAQYILNDTSLAAVILPNNDRHLYFQDGTGRIRYAIRTASNNLWNTSPDSNSNASAKNHTPLAVTAFRPDGPVKVWAAVFRGSLVPCQADLQVQIELFYVSQNYQLSSSIMSGDTGTWQDDGSLSKYTTAPNTRSLSVTSNLQAISNATNPAHGPDWNVTTTMAVLFYESPNGSVAVLSRFAEGCSEDLCAYDDNSVNPLYTGDNRNFSWIDNSPVLHQYCGLFPNSKIQWQCHTPFASSESTGGNFSVGAFFQWKSDSNAGFLNILYSPSENIEDPHIDTVCKYR